MMNSRRKRRQGRRSMLTCESLEGRVVLTYAGPSSVLGSLTYVGVVTTPIVSGPIAVVPIEPPAPLPVAASWLGGAGTLPVTFPTNLPGFKPLETDLQALETELQSLAGKSGVTIADLQSLTSDSLTISQAGFSFEGKSLNPVISELAVAVAGGSSTAQAQSDFAALFSGSNVTTATIASTFADLVKTIGDSGVTTTDLSAVASDEAAIQSDLSKLRMPWTADGEAWLDQVTSTPETLSLSTAVTSPAPVAATILPLLPVIPQPIIVSPFGANSFLGSLSTAGVVTSPVLLPPRIGIPLPILDPPGVSVPPIENALAAVTVLPNIPATSSGAWSQLQTDVQKLQTELQSLAAKSGLTIADLESLTVDSQTITKGGFFFNEQSLNKAISELATAVAGGSSTAQAQSDFAALFSGSNVATATINTAFADLTKAIQDSAVLPGDLTTVAADQAAIQTDLKNLFPGKAGGGTGSGSTGTGSGGTTGTGSGTGSTGSKSGHKKVVGHHKAHAGGHVVVLKRVKALHGRELGRSRKH